MTREFRPLAALVLGAAVFAATSAFADDGKPFSTQLTGGAEKPNPGDPDGMGAAELKLDAAQGQVCYELSATNIGAATMAHIHKAPADAAGPPVITLAAPDASGKSSACVNADKALVADIQQNPSAYYVNVHNAEFPAGAIRGQFGK